MLEAHTNLSQSVPAPAEEEGFMAKTFGSLYTNNPGYIFPPFIRLTPLFRLFWGMFGLVIFLIILLIVLIIIAIICCCRRRKKKQAEKQSKDKKPSKKEQAVSSC
jgi:predicted lipid-binding transport protein (Tim44 family)